MLLGVGSKVSEPPNGSIKGHDCFLTSRNPRYPVGNIEASHELEVQESGDERVQLIRHPEISKGNLEEWSGNHSSLKINKENN